MIVICECCNILQIESILIKFYGLKVLNVLWLIFCDSIVGLLIILEFEDVSIDGKKGLFIVLRKIRCSFKVCVFW